MKQTSKSRILTAALVPMLAMAGLALSVGGCGSTGRSTAPTGINGTVAQARELTLKGDRAFERGELQEAEALYRKSLSILREQPGALNNLGNVLIEARRYVDGHEVFKLATELDPTRPEIYSNHGRLWLEAGYAGDAVKYFDQALGYNPRWLPAIRGKIKANHLLTIADPDYLAMLNRAMVIESDDSWRVFFDRERARVQSALSAEENLSDSGG